MKHLEEKTAACRYISHRSISDSPSANADLLFQFGFTAISPEMGDPFKRVGTAQEIADVVAWPVRKRAGRTGQNIQAGGGIV